MPLVRVSNGGSPDSVTVNGEEYLGGSITYASADIVSQYEYVTFSGTTTSSVAYYKANGSWTERSVSKNTKYKISTYFPNTSIGYRITGSGATGIMRFSKD